MESQVLSQTYTEVQQLFSSINDPAHGWEHVSRVYAIALYIAQQEGADQFIVGMAALLHDLGHTAAHDETEHHADLSVKLAGEVLDKYAVTPEQREAILHAVIAHSFSRGVEPRTLEARVVRDADRLDGIGAIGIMRWAVTGTMRRTPETLVYHPTDPFAEKHQPDDKHYMLDHFYRKLLKLHETMLTETGRFMAVRRTGFMKTYLYEFRKELELS